MYAAVPQVAQPNQQLTADEEAVIICRCRAGDWSSYGRLVTRYRRLVWAAVDAVLMGLPEEAAEEAVQEVFIRAFEKLHTYRGSGAFSTWLFALARNHALSLRRRRARRPQPASIEAWMEDGRTPRSLAVGDGNPAAEYAAAQQRRALERAMAQLPQQYLEALNLYYLNELSYEEVSIVLKIPINTVKTRLRRAKNKLLADTARLGWAGVEDV